MALGYFAEAIIPKLQDKFYRRMNTVANYFSQEGLELAALKKQDFLVETIGVIGADLIRAKMWQDTCALHLEELGQTHPQVADQAHKFVTNLRAVMSGDYSRDQNQIKLKVGGELFKALKLTAPKFID